MIPGRIIQVVEEHHIKLVRWEYKGRVIPMMDHNSVLYTVNNQLAGAIHINPYTLLHTAQNRPDVFSNPNLIPDEVKRAIRQYRDIFEIERVRRIWTEVDCLWHSALGKSDVCKDFLGDYIQFMKENIRKGLATREELAQVAEQNNATSNAIIILEAKLRDKDALIREQNEQLQAEKSFRQEAVSSAGTLLREHKDFIQ